MTPTQAADLQPGDETRAGILRTKETDPDTGEIILTFDTGDVFYHDPDFPITTYEQDHTDA